MKYKTLLLAITILAMSIATLFTACPEPEVAPKSTVKKPEVAPKSTVKKHQQQCDGKPWAPKQWCTSTIAGGDTAGFADGTGTAAKFRFPYGIAVATDGTIYVADTGNQRIRKLTRNEDGTAYTVSTIAGSSTASNADGTGTAAKFNGPAGIAVATDGTIYVADTRAHRIRKLTRNAADGTYEVTTIAGDGHISDVSTGAGAHKDAEVGTNAQFDHPRGIAVATDGTLYVADRNNQRIRKLTRNAADGTYKVTTIAGSSTASNADGTGTNARFKHPTGIAVATDGITLYVADRLNNRIRKLTRNADGTTYTVSTIAGSTQGSADGTGTAAKFNGPAGIAVATDGTLYVADRNNNRIRKLTRKTNGAYNVTTIAGSTSDLAVGTKGSADGTGTAAKFDHPRGIAVATDGTLYVADTINSIIRKLEYKKVVE